MSTISEWIMHAPEVYTSLPAEEVEGRMDLALLALRQPEQGMNTGLIGPIWLTVPENLRNDILLELISTGCGRDFRIIYELKMVHEARALHRQQRKREMLCMALHPRVGRGTHMGWMDELIMQMLLRYSDL